MSHRRGRAVPKAVKHSGAHDNVSSHANSYQATQRIMLNGYSIPVRDIRDASAPCAAVFRTTREIAGMTVRELRRRWKPTKERLAGHAIYEPLLIRIHRACSWLQRAESHRSDAVDAAFVFQWVAFNSLYGKWNAEAREPHPDRITFSRFLDRVIELDEEQRIDKRLISEKRLAISIFEDAYLAKHFWEEPSRERMRESMTQRQKAVGWFERGQTGEILFGLMHRIYLLRCQLVHGAATCGGKLNRQPLQRCSRMMQHLLPEILIVMMDCGIDEDWGTLCYPPHKRLPA